MIEDFTIKDGIYLVSGEDTLDLHNNYDFTEITYSVAERRATLTWVRSSGDWVPATDPLELQLEFHGVSCFRFMPRDPEMPFTEDDCLDSIGFTWDEMLAEMDGYTASESKDDCTHLIAMFASSFSIKVGAEAVTLNVTTGA